jgi:polyprenyl-phospho-N-acetylgalactosaminyl synthase
MSPDEPECMSPRSLVIVPCYNESEVVRETAERLLRCGHEVVIVDDGSEPAVAASLDGLPVHMIRHEIYLGQGAALQTGMEYALRQGAAFVVHFDADGQHQPEDIPALLQPLLEGTADVVLGSRFLTRGDAACVPALRRLLLRCARLMNALLTGLLLTDAHNGMRSLNRRALESIELVENRMAHATELLQVIRKKRLRWCERPTHVVYTPYSRRKGQGVLNSVNILLDLLLRKLE